MKIKIHDDEIGSVMSEICVDSFPGVRLFDVGDLAIPEGDVLARWQAEDLEDARELENSVTLSLAWLGV